MASKYLYIVQFFYSSIVLFLYDLMTRVISLITFYTYIITGDIRLIFESNERLKERGDWLVFRQSSTCHQPV